MVDVYRDRIVRVNELTGAGYTYLGKTGSGTNQPNMTLLRRSCLRTRAVRLWSASFSIPRFSA